MPSYSEDQIAIQRALSQKVLAELLEDDLDRAGTKVKELGALLGTIRNLSERIDDFAARTEIHIRANALQSALGPDLVVKRRPLSVSA